MPRDRSQLFTRVRKLTVSPVLAATRLLQRPAHLCLVVASLALLRRRGLRGSVQQLLLGLVLGLVVLLLVTMLVMNMLQLLSMYKG